MPATRRVRPRPFSVRQRKDRNRRDASPVTGRRLRERLIRRPVPRIGRALRARPKMKSTPFASHQAMGSSRQKPESPRTAIRTEGHASRIRPAIPAGPPAAPSAASMSEGRRRATGTCSPQVT